MIGYLDRSGNFIDVSQYNETPFSHLEYCSINNIDEDHDLLDKGYVKLTLALPSEYIYAASIPMTSEQVQWLESNGYEVDEWDKP